MQLPIAHAGHWVESVIMMAPLLAFTLWLGIVTLRDRSARRADEHVPEGEDDAILGGAPGEARD